MSLWQSRRLKSFEGKKKQTWGSMQMPYSYSSINLPYYFIQLKIAGGWSRSQLTLGNAVYILDSLPVQCRTNAETRLCVRDKTGLLGQTVAVTRQPCRRHNDGWASPARSKLYFCKMTMAIIESLCHLVTLSCSIIIMSCSAVVFKLVILFSFTSLL